RRFRTMPHRYLKDLVMHGYSMLQGYSTLMQSRRDQVLPLKIKEVDFTHDPKPVIVIRRIPERVVEDTKLYRYFASPKDSGLAKITDIQKPEIRPTLGVIAFHN